MKTDFNQIAAELIAGNQLDYARAVLERNLAMMPANWKPIVEDANTLSIAFWDQNEFLLHTAKMRPGKTVAWVRPSYSQAWYLLSFIEMKAGNFAQALRCSAAGLNLELDHPDLLINHAMALSQLNRLPEAVQAYQGAARSRIWTSAQKRAQALVGAGAALTQLGRLDEAEAALQESLKLDSRYPTASQHLAYIQQLRSQRGPGGNNRFMGR